jgi:hypothetical protein
VSDFDTWLREMSPESFEEGAFIPDVWVGWLRRLYEQDGPLPADEVTARAARDVRAVAAIALVRVRDDLERVEGPRRHMELVANDELRVAYLLEDEVAEEPPQGLSTPDQGEMLVAVADAVFDLVVDEEGGLGPFVCPEHGFGLHPQVAVGRAVWRCRPSEHIVAAIGHLGERPG